MSDGTVFISVVIPVYNSKKYLDQCLSSVLGQTFHNTEVILVDDESKDGSALICDNWQKRYPDRIRVIHQKNEGVYIAKQKGIRMAKGEYVYVMDNDDLITTPNAFSEIHDTLLSDECDLLIFNVTDNIQTGHLLSHIPFRKHQVFEKESLSIIYDEYLRTKRLHHIWMMIFKRELFNDEFIYNKDFRMLRDGPALVLPIISKANRIMYVDKVYYYWRVQNQTSASKHYNAIGFYKSIQYLHEMIKENANSWRYISEKTSDLINSNYVNDICIAAVKSRGITAEDNISCKQFIKMLAEDEEFRKAYSLKNLDITKKIVAFALYHHMLWLVEIVVAVVKILK